MSVSRSAGALFVAVFAAFVVGCGSGNGGKSDEELTPGRPTAPRLTTAQYRNTIEDLLGTGLPQPALEIDTKPYLFSNVGAARTTISEEGVQQWEQAAHEISTSVVNDVFRRQEVVGCDPVSDDQCVTTFLDRFGRKAWRRPLTVAELTRYTNVARELADGDPWKEIYYALAGLLQSPNFLYRVTVGEPDPEDSSQRLYTSWEMASRLSYLFWNTTPDDVLLNAAMRRDLTTPESIRAHAIRLSEDERARKGLQTFFSELLGLSALDQMQRDPEVYPNMTETLGASMRTEIELLVDDIVFERDADVRELFSTRTTFVNAELAMLYGLSPISPEAGFVRVTLPPSSGRGGLLTTAGMLAGSSLATRTSPTKRGIMVRNFLCESVPPPPADVMTQLPDDGSTNTDGLTIRQRLELHRSEQRCAQCHALMDPIGIGLDEFDAIGARRTMEEGLPIDARGELDEIPFEGGLGLADLLRQDERVPRCLLIQAYRYSAGRLETADELRAINRMTEDFEANGYSFKSMLVELASSDLFRRMTPPDTFTTTSGSP